MSATPERVTPSAQTDIQLDRHKRKLRDNRIEDYISITKILTLVIVSSVIIAIALSPSPGTLLYHTQPTETPTQTLAQTEPVTEPTTEPKIEPASEQIPTSAATTLADVTPTPKPTPTERAVYQVQPIQTPVQNEPSNEPTYTSVTIEPRETIVTPNETFTVKIWINNVTDMAGWQIKLTWKRDIIKCIKAQINTPPEWGGTGFDWYNKTESDVDPEAVYTAWQFGPGIQNEYNDTCGQYSKGECFGPNGSDYDNTFSGTIAIVTLTFQALQPGSTSLSLWKTECVEWSMYPVDVEGVIIGDRDALPIVNTVNRALVEVQAP